MKNTENKFDMEALIKAMGEDLRSGKPLTGTGGVFTPLIKKVIEASLEGEMDAHLSEEGRSSVNRRNGRGRKNVLSSLGGLDIFSPRDRDGTFQPQTVKKRQDFLLFPLNSSLLFFSMVAKLVLATPITGICSFSVDINALPDQISDHRPDIQNRRRLLLGCYECQIF